MTWIQLRLHIQPGEAGELEALLLASGAVAVTLEDDGNQPVLEPGVGETPLWPRTRLTGLYAADTAMQDVLLQLPAHLRRAGGHRVEILEDKDWERAWMEHYRPMRFGSRLWVCPSWLEPPEPGAVNLLLDPGLAFGTGTHPTTALCLEQLDGLALSGTTVVDYGCGSGILALAALKLGAAMALGVDTDPQALSASRENALRNAIAPQDLQLVLAQDFDSPRWQHAAHVVVANILAGPLVALSNTLLQLLRPGGMLLLSGLLASQSTALRDHYADRITLQVAGEKDGWVCLRGVFSSR